VRKLEDFTSLPKLVHLLCHEPRPVNMTPKLFILAAMVVAALGSGPPSSYGSPSYGDIQPVRDAVNALEQKLFELAVKYEDSLTLSDVTYARQKYIEDYILPYLASTNEDQDNEIARYKEQIAALQAEADRIAEEEAKYLEIAKLTAEQIDTQEIIVSEINSTDNAQMALAMDIKERLSYYKDDIVYLIDDVAYYLDYYKYIIAFKIYYLKAFVAGRKCEYGAGTFAPGDDPVFVPFKTPFDTDDYEVTYAAVGEQTHLDIHTYDNKDVIYWEKPTVLTKTSSGFYMSIDDQRAEGMVNTKKVFCSWQACQYLRAEANVHDYVNGTAFEDVTAEDWTG